MEILDQARIAGVVRDWRSGHGFVVATRSEHVRTFLLGAQRSVSAVSPTQLVNYRAALEQAQLIDLPGYYFAPLLLAAINGQMGNQAEAQNSLEALLALRPDYAKEMRANFAHAIIPSG